MACLHPVLRTYLDLSGREQSVPCPCGHCILCQMLEQDSWSIRLRETASRYNTFIYETLTIRDSSLPKLDVSDICLDPAASYSLESANIIDHYSVYESGKGMSYYVPYLDKTTVSAWIKRGRELYFKHHGKRLNFKYFIVMEYGPKWSRPHLHCLFFGLNEGIYNRYFAHPWSLNYGFTKTQVIKGGTDKDRDCITRYVSKYVSKGTFESPLVRDGFVQKPWRMVSNGIGSEYLDNPKFDSFKTYSVDILQSMTINKSSRTLLRSLNVRNLLNKYDILDNFKFMGSLESLTTYYDSKGYPHSLPRYYKHKLLKLDNPNVFSFKIQNDLLVLRQQGDYKRLQNFIRCYHPELRIDPTSKTLGLSKGLFDKIYRECFIRQRDGLRSKSKAAHIKLKNHFGRTLSLPNNYYII